MELQLEAVTKSYKSKQVLKGITLTMWAGVYGLLGLGFVGVFLLSGVKFRAQIYHLRA